ncbi:MAG TPA: DUF3618 domain-containing protein [Sandaracinaceae bacterium]
MSNGSENDIDALRADIEHTRERISGEIEAIGERLTPAHAREVAKERMVEAKDRAVANARGKMVHAKDRAVRGVRDAAHRAYEAGSDFPRIVRENPIPAAMVLVGTGWLVYSAMRSRRPSIEIEVEREPELEAEAEEIGGGEVGVYQADESTIEITSGAPSTERGRAMDRARERVGKYAQSAKERLGGTAGSVKERLSGTAGSVKERAGRIATRGREGANQVWGRSQNVYGSNPLAVGAVCLFTGIGLGMLLPHTSRENRMLGERRQRLVERARQAAAEAKDVAIHSAKEGMKAARETAKKDASERELVPR